MKKRNFFRRLLKSQKDAADVNDSEPKSKEKPPKPPCEFNVSGGQINIVSGEGTIYATVNQEDGHSDVSRENRFKNNQKQNYIRNWTNRLFLHLDNDERPLTLEDTFIMPDCGYRVTLKRTKYSKDDDLESLIYKFVKYEKNSNMLIVGEPGVGKSTVTSWIAWQNRDDDNFIILRFRDWESEELKKGLLKSVCTTLECKKADLENKILVLDGFDEMKTLDIRVQVLNTFLNDIKDFENFKCIITSRPAYIDDTSCFYNRFQIKPFGKEKISSFYQKITGHELTGIIDHNLDVLGIPVILYMAIMSDIDITQKTSKPELYNRIFAEQGGIFDRFCEYDNGSQLLRNPENIKKHLGFLKEVAFTMFADNNLRIPKDECRIPELSAQGKLVSILEFPIKHLFENTNPNIEFIHKSIYEYFVAEHIATLIIDAAGKDKKYFAGILGRLLKDNKLSGEIIEFLKYKANSKELHNVFEALNDAFNLMLRDGMTYHTEGHYKKVHICEKNVFINMLEILHLWEVNSIKVDSRISDYLKYNENNLNLERMDLREVDLSRAYLRYANMQKANLSKGDFSDVGLENTEDDSFEFSFWDGDFGFKGTDFLGANLKGADFRGRNIEQIDFEGTVLQETIFDERQISYLVGKYDLNNTRVYIKETKEIIYYQEYKNRRLLDKKEGTNLFITLKEENV